MKTSEKESTSTPISRGGGSGGGGRGRGRGGGRGGRGGGRGGGRSSASRSSSGENQRSSGGRGGNHGRHPRQNKQQQGTQNQSGRGRGKGRGRPRSSSYNEKNVDKCPVKKTGPYAHLFCSDRHAFALSRVFYPRGNDQFLLPSHHYEEHSNIHRIASDDQLEGWWECVKIVKCHVPFDESSNGSSLERCPICLDDEMVSPFIAPCGHAFCLPCVLGYLNSVAKDLNTESERINKSKQNVKGSAGVVGNSALTNRASVTSIRARCPMCSSGSSMVLNAGDAMITYKDLRPVVFVPVLTVTAASVGESKGGKGKKYSERANDSKQLGTRMRFVKLHRVKSCPAPYLPLNGHRVRGIIRTTNSELIPEQRLPDIPDGDDDAEKECIYAKQYFVGLNEYDNILQRDLDDLNNYRENTPHCQLDPRESWNVAMAIEAIQASQRRWLGNGGDGGFRGMELEAKSVATANDKLGNNLLIEATDNTDNNCANQQTENPSKGHKNTALLKPGSFYLQQNQNSSQGEADEYLYYQSSDGQPCFLSGINVACLMHEFSLHRSAEHDVNASELQDDDAKCDQGAPTSTRKILPLPDELTGTVVEVEHLAVTNSLIKRKPFLSHLPLNSSVLLVEIDWYSGGDGRNRPMLSHQTLSKFRGELARRKSERLRVAKQEQKADKVARVKSEKEEQRRRRELLGSSYTDSVGRQSIDPDDDFFQAPAASFDGRGEGAQDPAPTFQFNEVCATGGVWPELSSSVGSGQRETVVASASPVQSSHVPISPSSPPQANTTWAKRSTTPKTVAVVNSFPSLAESLSAQKPQSREPSKSHWGSR